VSERNLTLRSPKLELPDNACLEAVQSWRSVEQHQQRERLQIEPAESFGVVGIERPSGLRFRQNLDRRRKFNIAVQSVTSTHGSLRQPNPILHGVPLSVIPNEQIFLRAVRALDRALVIRVYFVIV
jgi:hypothetical protein